MSQIGINKYLVVKCMRIKILLTKCQNVKIVSLGFNRTVLSRGTDRYCFNRCSNSNLAESQNNKHYCWNFTLNEELCTHLIIKNNDLIQLQCLNILCCV
jgi:hypothetical protein